MGIPPTSPTPGPAPSSNDSSYDTQVQLLSQLEALLFYTPSSALDAAKQNLTYTMQYNQRNHSPGYTLNENVRETAYNIMTSIVAPDGEHKPTKALDRWMEKNYPEEGPLTQAIVTQFIKDRASIESGEYGK